MKSRIKGQATAPDPHDETLHRKIPAIQKLLFRGHFRVRLQNDAECQSVPCSPIRARLFEINKGQNKGQKNKAVTFSKEKRRKTKKIALNHNYSRRFVAAGEGFEPSHTESESAVLPLHNPAKRKAIIHSFLDLSSIIFPAKRSRRRQRTAVQDGHGRRPYSSKPADPRTLRSCAARGSARSSAENPHTRCW